jgi:malate synthase
MKGRDLDPLPLPASSAHRSRGRPRRQAAKVPLEESVLEPLRRLRSRQNGSKEVSKDPWTKLSNAPYLTPLSPKKNRQAKIIQHPPHPPVIR